MKQDSTAPSGHLDPETVAREIAQELRETIFASGLRVSPRRVKQIAQELAADFFSYIDAPNGEMEKASGRRLAQDGLGHRSILQATEAIRRTCRERSYPSVQLPEVAGRYVGLILEGYMAGREELLLQVQERTHRAFLRALDQDHGDNM